VALDAGVVVGHAFLFRLEGWFGGARVRVGGVASVGVAPEARGRGVGSALVEHLHGVSQEHGDAVTVLYAFRQEFYARLGYAPTSATQRLRFDPRAVPAWSCPGVRVRAARGEDRQDMARLREEAAREGTGMLARTRRHWDALLSDERTTWVVAVRGGGAAEGYVAFSLEQAEPHAKTTLTVHEVVARGAEIERHLWATVASQRASVAEVQTELPLDHPLAHALVDADRARFGDARVEHTLGEIAAGPMVRLVDVARALEARGWRDDGTFRLGVGADTLAIEVRAGRANVGRADGPGDLSVRDARDLAAIAFGGLTPARAERLGMAMLRDEARTTVENALAIPPYFSPDAF
jgi:predicted acetyltransferase